MDPEACLDRAARALTEGDTEECADALKDYRAWRRNGGFEPENGDKRAGEIRAALGEVLHG